MRIATLIFINITFASCAHATNSSLPPADLSNSPALRAGPSLKTDTSFRSLYRFQAGTDGAHPYAGLTAVNGMLYGTTAQGAGSGCAAGGGCGTVFGISISGKEHVMYSFKGGSDGGEPFGGLLNLKGKLYGTTYLGGGGQCSDGSGGCGTVFEVSTSGKERVIYSFQGGKDGAIPRGSLVADKSGAIYGATEAGGGASACATPSGVDGCGTVFRLTPSRSGYSEKVLYSFQGGNDGGQPYGGLIAYTGALYGTTSEGGGSGCSGDGCGTVFEVSTSGDESLLYSFAGYPKDGALPEAALLAFNGSLYGTTVLGGSDSDGTVFEISTAGEEQVLCSFYEGGNNGAFPEAGLIAVNGKLFGTTAEGGAYKSGEGTIFELNKTDEERVLHNFASGEGGSLPYAGLLDNKGILYGTTEAGGSNNNGTIFRVSP